MRKLLLLLTILISVSASAQDFKILFLNTETIRIGGKNLKKGDYFNQSDKIQWSNDEQAMRVLSLSDKKQFILVSNDFKERELKSAKDFMVKTHHLSTRGIGSLSTVARKLGETIYVIDTTVVVVNYLPDASEYFFVTFDGSRRTLDCKDGNLVLTPDIWAKNEPVNVCLLFHNADGIEEMVSESIQIVPLPEKISKTKKKKK